MLEPTRSVTLVIKVGVFAVNVWLVCDHSNRPYELDAKSNQYVPSAGLAVGGFALPTNSDKSVFTHRTNALFANPKKE